MNIFWIPVSCFSSNIYEIITETQPQQEIIMAFYYWRTILSMILNYDFVVNYFYWNL